MKMKVRMVLGASRSQAGVQPFIRNRGPSFRNESATIFLTLGLTPFTATAFCTLLFKTSAGAQAVVATVPARREARKCVGMPSLRPREGLDNSSRLAAEYLEKCEHPGLRRNLHNIRGNLRNIHDDASDDVWPQATGESSNAFLFADPDQSIECVCVPKPLCWWSGAICTHSNESDLSRVPHKTSKATCCSGASNLYSARQPLLSSPLPGFACEVVVQAESCSRVRRLSKHGSGYTPPK